MKNDVKTAIEREYYSLIPPQKHLYLPKRISGYAPDTSAADATASCMDWAGIKGEGKSIHKSLPLVVNIYPRTSRCRILPVGNTLKSAKRSASKRPVPRCPSAETVSAETVAPRRWRRNGGAEMSCSVLRSVAKLIFNVFTVPCFMILCPLQDFFGLVVAFPLYQLFIFGRVINMMVHCQFWTPPPPPCNSRAGLVKNTTL